MACSNIYCIDIIVPLCGKSIITTRRWSIKIESITYLLKIEEEPSAEVVCCHATHSADGTIVHPVWYICSKKIPFALFTDCRGANDWFPEPKKRSPPGEPIVQTTATWATDQNRFIYMCFAIVCWSWYYFTFKLCAYVLQSFIIVLNLPNVYDKQTCHHDSATFANLPFVFLLLFCLVHHVSLMVIFTCTSFCIFIFLCECKCACRCVYTYVCLYIESKVTLITNSGNGTHLTIKRAIQ